MFLAVEISWCCLSVLYFSVVMSSDKGEELAAVYSRSTMDAFDGSNIREIPISFATLYVVAFLQAA